MLLIHRMFVIEQMLYVIIAVCEELLHGTVDSV